jgi:hypothetical protein
VGRKENIMGEVQPNGFWKCLGVCTLGCAAGCSGCVADAAVVILDAATGTPSLMSGMSAGANS